MIRLLCCIGSLQGGGAERQLVQLLRRFDRSRIQPFLYLVSKTGPLLTEVPADVPVTAFSERDRPPWLNWPGRRFRQRVCDLAQVLRDWRIDCVYDRTYHMTLITAPACQRTGVPRISTVVSEPRSDFDLQERRFRAVKWWLLNQAYRTADRVVAVSDGVRNGLLESHHLSAQQVVTIHNPVDRDRIERLSTEPLPPNWNPAERHIVAVGRLGPEKDFSTLIESVRILLQQNEFGDVRMWILGEGLLREQLTAEITAAGLSQHVLLRGFVVNPYPAIRHAAVLALSSRHEGLPGAILEAMTLGTPVVSTDCKSGPAELLAGGRFGTLVPVGTPERLAAGLAEVLRDPAEARAKAVAGQTHIQEMCGAAATLERLQSLVEQVVAERESRSRKT
jgi:glycosyltransferase involved in cell wall biosynthesis